MVLVVVVVRAVEVMSDYGNGGGNVIVVVSVVAVGKAAGIIMVK